MQLESKSSAMEALQAKFDELRTDFKFNLSVLDERDAELEQYDAAFQKMAEEVSDAKRESREAVHVSSSALSELKIAKER